MRNIEVSKIAGFWVTNRWKYLFHSCSCWWSCMSHEASFELFVTWLEQWSTDISFILHQTDSRAFSWVILNHWKGFIWSGSWVYVVAKEIIIILDQFLDTEDLVGRPGLRNAHSSVAFTTSESIDIVKASILPILLDVH